MGSMGAELFEMSWVQGIVQFFNYLAWTLYVIGLIVACFECGINYAGGKGDIRAVALKLSKAGKQKELADIFAKFGCKKLSDFDSRTEDYPSLMKELVSVNG